MPLLEPLAIVQTLLALLAVALAGGVLLRETLPDGVGAAGAARFALALILGLAGHAAGADVGVKLFGPTIYGFWVAPLAFMVALAAIASFTSSGVKPPQPPAPILEVPAGALWIALLFGFVVAAQVVPLKWGEGVLWGTAEMDWRSRIPTVNAIARDGLPATNPYYDADKVSKLFFYYGYFLFPAGLVRSGLDSVTVLAVCVFALATSIATLALAIAQALGGARAAKWAGLLLFTTGLDLLPVLGLHRQGIPPESLEWWSPAQVTAMTAFPAWVPHHAAATVFILAAPILLAAAGVRRAFVPAALLLHAAGISSTYVAMVGFAALAAAAVWRAWRSREFGAALPELALCAVAGLATIPFYAQLARLDRHVGPSLALAVRPFHAEEDLAKGFSGWMSPDAARTAARILGLIPQYIVEFGALFLVLLYWRSGGPRGDRPDDLAPRLGAMTVAALFLASLLVSVRTWNCDLNWRALHVVQIVLVGVGGVYLAGVFSPGGKVLERFIVGGAIGVGLAGTAYDLARERFDYLLPFRRDLPAGPRLLLAERVERAGAELNARLGWNRRIQYDPQANPAWIMRLRHHVVVSDYNFNSLVYGVNQAEVGVAIEKTKRLFLPETSAADRRALVKELGIEGMLIEAESPLFGKSPRETLGENATETIRGVDWRLLAVDAPAPAEN
ncbi:MAG TPA: hypothetical protein VNC50_15880 [Planctomycetia bacterium]|nr:hypothetical protein [Planctomycetia bacterium]